MVNFRPPDGSKTPEQISMNLGIYLTGLTTQANPCGAVTTWVVSVNVWLVTCFGFLVYLYLSFFMAALLNRARRYIFARWFLSSSFFFIPRLISVAVDWMSTVLFYTWCGPSVNLERRSEMCCTRLVGNARPKNCEKFAIWAPSHNFVGLYIYN